MIWFAVAVIVVFLGGGYVLPGEAVVQRQIVIAAPPEKVFAVIGSLKRFNEWSPWAELIPIPSTHSKDRRRAWAKNELHVEPSRCRQW